MGLAFAIVLGCDEDSNFGNGGWGGDPPSITLSMQADTLRFLPGDLTSTTLTIIVSNPQGNIVPGERVELSLSDSSLGFITCLDTLLQDTTNAQGRVNFEFTSVGIEGDQIFTARAIGATATRQLAIRVIPTVIEVEIDMTPLIAVPGQEMTIGFDVWYSLADGTPLADRQLTASAAGNPDFSLPFTDESGRTEGQINWEEEFGDIVLISVTDGYVEGRDSTAINIGSD